MIIGTYDDHTYDYGPADNHSQSSSTPDESDPLDDLEPFVNSQKFDPAACNFNKGSVTVLEDIETSLGSNCYLTPQLTAQPMN